MQIRFRRRLCHIVTSANLELGRNVLSINNPGGASIVKSAVGMYSWQLSEMENDCPDQISECLYLREVSPVDYDPDDFYLLCGRLQVQAFHFFLGGPDRDDITLAKLHVLACTAIEKAVHLDTTEDLTGSASAYIQRTLVMAALIILRISRSHISPALDPERGRKRYHENILLHRKMSVQEGDLASRTAVILTGRWTSKNAFKKADGTTDSLTLFCRN